MGNKVASFTQEQLEEYQDCTFFTRKEILSAYKRFRELRPDIVPKDMTKKDDIESAMDQIKLSFNDMMKIAELKENPFSRRICEVFSDDGMGNLSFDDFLDMMNVFSEHAPRDLKAVYAFKIYDFDQDQLLSKYDLEKTVRCLTKDNLNQEEIDMVCDKVLEEADLDEDGMLSFIEFEHVISRAPDFVSTFHIRM